MQVVVEPRLGQVEAVQQLIAVTGYHRHPARTDRSVALQERPGQCLPLVRQGRVADQERSPPCVIADDGLEVGTLGLDRRQRERNAPVGQGNGSVPGHGELTGAPAIGLGPRALAVVGCAVIADFPGDLELIGLPSPEPGQCRERGRDAVLMVLTHEADGEPDATAVGPRVLEPVGQREEERLAALAGKRGSSREVAQTIGRFRAAADQPATGWVVNQGREIGKPIEAAHRVGVAADL